MTLQLPSCAGTATVDLPSGPLALVETKPARKHRTVILVPGYTGSKEDFLSILPQLTDAGHRVVAYDQRGQYESPGDDDPEAYTVEALADDLLALIESLGDDRAHVVGHSFGGLVARAAAIRDPTLFRSLTLLDSGPAAIPGLRAERIATLRPLLVQGGKEAVWQHPSSGGGVEPVPPDVSEFLARRFFANHTTGLLVMGDALLNEPDRTAALRACGIPVLVAYGEHDDAWPPAVQQDMAHRLGAWHAVIDGATHSPAVEQPDATAKVLLDFWAAT